MDHNTLSFPFLVLLKPKVKGAKVRQNNWRTRHICVKSKSPLLAGKRLWHMWQLPRRLLPMISPFPIFDTLSGSAISPYIMASFPAGEWMPCNYAAVVSREKVKKLICLSTHRWCWFSKQTCSQVSPEHVAWARKFEKIMQERRLWSGSNWGSMLSDIIPYLNNLVEFYQNMCQQKVETIWQRLWSIPGYIASASDQNCEKKTNIWIHTSVQSTTQLLELPVKSLMDGNIISKERQACCLLSLRKAEEVEEEKHQPRHHSGGTALHSEVSLRVFKLQLWRSLSTL